MNVWLRAALLAGVCLVVLALGVVGYAQVAVQPVAPQVLSGTDLGFRVEGMRGGTPVGTLVVKVNGRWVDADFKMGPKSLGTN